MSMLIPPGPIRVLVATKPVDFRKGMDGLAALVKEQLKADPFLGRHLRLPAPSAPDPGEAAVLGRQRRMPVRQTP